MTCQITVQWDSTMCLIFNCKEIPPSLTPCLLYWKHCGQYDRHSATIIKSHLSVQIHFSDVRKMTQSSLSSKETVHTCFFRLSLGEIEWFCHLGTRQTQKWTGYSNLFNRVQQKHATEFQNLRKEGPRKVSKNHHIGALLAHGDIHAQLAVLYSALFTSILWCQKRTE